VAMLDTELPISGGNGMRIGGRQLALAVDG
jgi:hypothetical protein